MKAQPSAHSRFVVSMAVLLLLLPTGVQPAAAQPLRVAFTAPASPLPGAARETEASIPIADYGHTPAPSHSLPTKPSERAIGMAPFEREGATNHALQANTVTKTVTPTQQVAHGDEITYTLIISAAPGVQVGLYDPLTDTTFTRFVERPGTSTITHSDGVVTGTLTVTPTHQVTVSFAAQVGRPGTLMLTDQVTNRACIYPFGGTLGGCVWSNEATTLITHNVYLPLIVRNYEPIQAAFTASPTSGPAPLTVVFTNTSTGAYAASLWCFGDGITSTQTSPTHTYTAIGTYTITLTVSADTDHGAGMDGSDTLSRSNYITVTPSQLCVEGIANGGDLPITPYPADYTTATYHSGSRSMRTGIVEPTHNRESYSSARQTVTIPTDAVSATLRFWLYPVSGEPLADLAPSVRLPAGYQLHMIEEVALPGDTQYVLVLNQYNQWINTLVWQRRNDQTWMFHQFDLGIYAGQNIKLQFGVYNDGWYGVTAMYADDVSLEICTPAACTRQGLGN
jgi:PKD repeat protein